MSDLRTVVEEMIEEHDANMKEMSERIYELESDPDVEYWWEKRSYLTGQIAKEDVQKSALKEALRRAG